MGSGITRTLDEDINVTFMNNDKEQEFVITVWRGGKVTKSVTKSNKKVTKSKRKVTKSRKKVTKSKTLTLDLDTFAEDHNTGLRHSDTDLDTNHDTFAEDHDTRLRHYDTDLDTDHDTFAEDHDTIHSYHDTKRVPLTNKQKDIVNFCSVLRTSREFLERAGVVYHTKNIAKYASSG